jgi:hypothetical protein
MQEMGAARMQQRTHNLLLALLTAPVLKQDDFLLLISCRAICISSHFRLARYIVVVPSVFN